MKNKKAFLLFSVEQTKAVLKALENESNESRHGRGAGEYILTFASGGSGEPLSANCVLERWPRSSRAEDYGLMRLARDCRL